MKILIFGGTGFVGRAVVDSLSGNPDHQLTLFNRGKTAPDLFPDIKQLHGDRDSNDIEKITEQSWDLVLDISCYHPIPLKRLLNRVKQNGSRYLFISTFSAMDFEPDGEALDENSPLVDFTDEDLEDISPRSYNQRKAACEEVVNSALASPVILRPGLIFGPGDTSDRVYYWLYRIKKNMKILVPDPADNPVSCTYIDDLVLAIQCFVNNPEMEGTYHAISYPRFSIKELIAVGSEILKTNPRLIYAKPQFLEKQKISEWQDLPLWIDGTYFVASNSKLKTLDGYRLTGLKHALAETVKYYQDLNWPIPKTGISLEQEVNTIRQLEMRD